MAKKAEQDDENPILERARDFYEKAQDYWSRNHETGREDLRFARLEEQWHEADRKQRETDCRPCETFNKMPSFIRQVVNDARQNKPSIKVHAADDLADPETAEIYSGLIRNIEVISNADAAYDTGIESAADKGFGYWRINVKYACDDSFERDIIIERVMNAFTVFPDYHSEAVDSSDWNECLIVTNIPKDEFEAEYPKAERVNWDFDYNGMPNWFDGENVTVGEYWHREKVTKTLVSANGAAMWQEDFIRRVSEGEQLQLDPVEPEERPTYEVTQYILSGAEVLKTVKWAGKYIPIVPVWGDEIVTPEGRRLFRSMIYSAKGAQRMYNYMRNTGIEMVGLAPKTPWIGEEGTFDIDANWSTANTQTHPYLQYKSGKQPPQRTPYSGVPQGVVQETLAANDDMKTIIGLHDASLGLRGNETSGIAIRERKIEGDTATFHFVDNQNRAIRHTGLILIDLIPKVYSTERIVRVLGEDMKPRAVPVNQPVEMQDEQGNPITRVFDLTAGKYDLTVSSGPAFTSRREEANEVMTEVVRAFPPAAPILAPRIMKNLDIPDADEISKEFEALNPAHQQQQQGLPPEVQQMIEQGQQMLQQQAQEIQALQQQLSDKSQDFALKKADLALKSRDQQIDQFRAETERFEAQKPPPTAREGSATQ